MNATAAAPPSPAPADIDADASHRRCIVTGETGDRGALLRCVVSPQGEIVPDIDARLPGRGLWLLPRRDIVERAVAKRLFARAARRPVVVPPGLADRIESLLARRCCDTLGLARRAGAAVAGFERVGEAVRRGEAGLLLFARDSAMAGRRRLSALGRGVPTAADLAAEELSGAFGRERVAFVAVGPGTLCSRLRRDLGRLAGFRTAAGTKDNAAARPAQQDGGASADE